MMLNTISCRNKSCNFNLRYNCPFCESNLEASSFSSDDKNDYFTCEKCKKKSSVEKIQNIVNNLMTISQSKRCQLCNGVTIRRKDANIGERCYYFPSCSGQSPLFGVEKRSLVFLDFETSGFEFTKNHLIEIGAYKIDEEGLEHTFDTFIKPPELISDKISRITNITNDMLAKAPNIKEVIHDFYEFIETSTIIAHNAEFDIPWLIYYFNRFNLTTQKNKIVCTYKWSKKLKEPRASLGALTKRYKINHLNSHRALADAAATKELYFIFENFQTVEKEYEEIDTYKKLVEKAIQKNQKHLMPM